MKNTYCRQKYLFETDYSTVKLNILLVNHHNHYDFESIQDYHIPYNLFDYNQKYIRKISADILDEKADTIDEFKKMPLLFPIQMK